MRSHHILPAAPLPTLQAYLDLGGGSGLAAARARGPAAVIDEILAAGVRGRGGAGFPTGRKWGGVLAAREVTDDSFVVANAAEGEPGTFKDRALLRANPYQVLEGLVIAAETLGTPLAIVATKASFTTELARLHAAIAEIDAAGWLEHVHLAIVEGPDSYLFGEETAMLEVIEGEEPLPRHLAPYQYGLYTASPQIGWSAGTDLSTTGPTVASSNPTLVNNVETYAHVAAVLANGAPWYRSMGTEASPGPTIVTVSGDTARAAVAEVALGHRVGDVLDELGGGTPHAPLKAVFSGVANGVLTAGDLHAPLTYEGLAAVGSGMGSAGFVVYDARRNMVDVAYRLSAFLAVESCGQCSPCKLGTNAITALLETLVEGRATFDVVDRIAARLRSVTDGNRCYLPVQERVLVASILDRFPDDVAERLFGRRGDLDLIVPKILDLGDTVTYDTRHVTKRPDWTYTEGTPVRFGS